MSSPLSAAMARTAVMTSDAAQIANRVFLRNNQHFP
jgi:hypothetical protein